MTADTVITFRDLKSRFSVYRTFEDKQISVYDLFDITKKYTGELSKYDAGEFAAAFIAVAKKTKGEIRLIEPHAQQEYSIYCYEVYLKDGSVHIEYMD